METFWPRWHTTLSHAVQIYSLWCSINSVTCMRRFFYTKAAGIAGALLCDYNPCSSIRWAPELVLTLIFGSQWWYWSTILWRGGVWWVWSYSKCVSKQCGSGALCMWMKKKCNKWNESLSKSSLFKWQMSLKNCKMLYYALQFPRWVQFTGKKQLKYMWNRTRYCTPVMMSEKRSSVCKIWPVSLIYYIYIYLKSLTFRSKQSN